MVEQNTFLPVIAFAADGRVGSFVSVTDGTWVGAVGLTFQWRRNGVNIPGATNKSYRLVAADAGQAIDCAVTGTCPAVANTVAPVISGLLPAGSLLSTTNGTWTGSPVAFTYQWRRNGGALGGATASTYTTVAGDVGQSITCTVTATSACGSFAAQASNALVPTSAVVCCVDSNYTGKILTLTSTYISTSPAVKEVYEFRGVYSGGGVFTGKTHYRAWSMAAGYQLSCYNITALTLIADDCYNDTVEYRCNSVVDPAGFYFVGAAGSAASVYNSIYLPTTQPNCGRDPLCTGMPLSGFGVGKLISSACQYTYGCLGGTYQNDFCMERWSGTPPSTCVAPLGNSFEWQLLTTTISIASGVYTPICV